METEIDKEVMAIKNMVAKKVRLLEIEKEKIDGKIYRLKKMLEGMDDATDLKRIRRVSHEKVCGVCGEKFKTGTEKATICKKKSCRAAQAKSNRTSKKGVVLLPGDAVRAS